MTIERSLLAKAGQTTSYVYVEDVFSSWLRTGTGASSTITNNIDISTNGGLVITKSRSAATSWKFTDKTRGATYSLDSSSTSAQSTDANGLTAFTTSGYTIGSDTNYNNSGATYVDFAFRKQAKFFDIVTYTGTGSARTISHALGATPGMIIVKRTDTTANWAVYHSGQTSASYYTKLNLTDDQASDSTVWNGAAPTSSVFSVGTSSLTNANGGTYVAYIFASNAGGFGADGTQSVVKCGIFTTGGNGSATITDLGFEPQWVLTKCITGNNGANWQISDNMRGYSLTGAQWLYPSTSGSEIGPIGSTYPTSNGFTFTNYADATYIYLAIRRGPMKTPTDATKVFKANTRSGTGSAVTISGIGFPPDAIMSEVRTPDNFGYTPIMDKLRGTSSRLLVALTNAESADTNMVTSFNMDGVSLGSGSYYNSSLITGIVDWFFRRAPGFFDVVCYTGQNSSNTRVSHNLGVVPELIITKKRDGVTGWLVYTASAGINYWLSLQGSAALSTIGSPVWGSSSPTTTDYGFNDGATGFSWGTSPVVSYLFATCPGVSKVGSYTGTGSAQNINCGFAAGARFVLIKRTDSTGDWYVWDSARGINASGSNDPYMLLNVAAAEVSTTDYLGTYSSGFALTSSAPAAINANGGTYIYLAIA